MSIAARIVVLRAQATNRKAARERRRQLERELAGYSTAAQRADIEATLDRYPDGFTWELRDILARQAWARDTRQSGDFQQYRQVPGIGRRRYS